jgi:hypothetical protein
MSRSKFDVERDELKRSRKHQYEAEFEYTGRGHPAWLDDAYGFGNNPPVVIDAKNKKEARNHIFTTHFVKLKSLKKVS